MRSVTCYRPFQKPPITCISGANNIVAKGRQLGFWFVERGGASSHFNNWFVFKIPSFIALKDFVEINGFPDTVFDR